jgi:hypothetical protein
MLATAAPWVCPYNGQVSQGPPIHALWIWVPRLLWLTGSWLPPDLGGPASRLAFGASRVCPRTLRRSRTYRKLFRYVQ